MTPSLTTPVTLHSVRPTTQEEKNSNMPYFTSSILEAVNTCPKFGIIHSILSKRFVTGYRQMALEAGSLMHEVFSMLNLYQVGMVQQLPEHMNVHGTKEFSSYRWERVSQHFKPVADTSTESIMLEAAMFDLMATSSFYDDDNDRVRTLSNLEHCALELINYWLMNFRSFNIYISNVNDPTAPIGVEQSLDVVFNTSHGAFRFIGLVDALYQNKDTGQIKQGEYKTTSSMNDAWRMAFDTRHQITAYNAALHAYFDNVSQDVILLGSSIPVRKTTAPVQHFPVYRDESAVQQFLQTMVFTKFVKETFLSQPLFAPTFTHSCNRYFRPCAFIDLCSSALADQEAMLEQMEEASSLSPSEEKALLRRE